MLIMYQSTIIKTILFNVFKTNIIMSFHNVRHHQRVFYFTAPDKYSEAVEAVAGMQRHGVRLQHATGRRYFMAHEPTDAELDLLVQYGFDIE